MGAFDTVVPPASLTPANTSQATLFTAVADTSLVVHATNIVGSYTAVCSIFLYNGTFTSPLVSALPVPFEEGFILAPIFLRAGDAVIVQSGTASSVTYTAHGVRST